MKVAHKARDIFASQKLLIGPLAAERMPGTNTEDAESGKSTGSTVVIPSDSHEKNQVVSSVVFNPS